MLPTSINKIGCHRSAQIKHQAGLPCKLIGANQSQPAIKPKTLILVISIAHSSQLNCRTRTDTLHGKSSLQRLNKSRSLFIRAHTHQTTSAQADHLLLYNLNESFIGSNNTTTAHIQTITSDGSPFDKAISTIELKNHHSTSN
ncbi:hypothetical protein D9M69_623090 [compost metagenome]